MIKQAMITEITTLYLGTTAFALAILHTFSVSFFQTLSHKFQKGSAGNFLFHWLGEVEVVFGLWAGLFIIYLISISGWLTTYSYLASQNYTEPMFVVAIMIVCSSQPIIILAEQIIKWFSKIIPVNKTLAFFTATLVIGPLLGSFITEPAAMTVTASILLTNFYQKNISKKLKYATIGLLFVNISIAGTLTPYAAPPILMVASKWNWDLLFMLSNFGWKAFIATTISTSVVAFRFRNELKKLRDDKAIESLAIESLTSKIPFWVTGLHFFVLVSIVLNSHHLIVFTGLFFCFLGIVFISKPYQSELQIKRSLLVGVFLAGLVILGGFQNWWLEPLLNRLTSLPLYLGSISLTAFTDNAAITYLGSQVSGLSNASKYALVAGSVVGGGLTVIANAPNPAGYGTLKSSFGPEGINPVLLFQSALLPTTISGICFWFF